MNKNISKTTLVIGASENPSRYSNMAIKMLRAYDHEVIALGLRAGQVDGITIETDPEALKNRNIDTITLYINPVHQEKYKSIIYDLKPRRVIFNPGTENPDFEENLEKNGILTEEACTLVMLRTSQF